MGLNQGDASPALPPGTPTWLTSASRMLRSEPLGDEWSALVGLWEAFEVREGFTAPLNLSPKGRPPCVSDWIKRARSPAYRPTLSNLDNFERGFTEWWESLQPGWRRSPDGLTREAGDLEAVRKPGVNGLLSVLAALFFWGAQSDPMARDAWLHVVDDVSWTVGQFQRARNVA